MSWLKLAKLDSTKLAEEKGKAFICFYLPPDVKKKLKHLDNVDKQLHMTVLYIESGADKKSDKEDILNAVESVCSQTDPIKYEFAEIGCMGNDENSLVFNVNAMGAAEFYSKLVEEIECSWKEFDRKYDFLPHVTIQYEYDADNIDLDDFKKAKWTCDEVTIEFDGGVEVHKVKLGGKTVESSKRYSNKQYDKYWEDHGIKPQKSDPSHSAYSIGFSEKEQKWYGWSHRVIHGFAVGDVIKEGDCIVSEGWKPGTKIKGCGESC
jgi:2'-5' RNA ligase